MLLVLWRFVQEAGAGLFDELDLKICYQLPRIERTCAGFRGSCISSD